MNFNINIRLFADNSGGERTEKATPKRKRDVRKKGQVLQSREFSSAVVLLFLFLVMKLTGGNIHNVLNDFTYRLFSDYMSLEDFYTLASLNRFFSDIIMVVTKIIGPLLLTSLVIGISISYAQVGFLLTGETLSFKFERLNPINGFKRMFSIKSLAELLKSILKIVVLGYIGYSFIRNEIINIQKLPQLNISNVAGYISNTVINTAIRLCIGLIILGIIDYMYQWWEYDKNLRMTKQEVKEEYKQTEGNPEIKSRIRQKQRQVSMQRMMHSVPQADVVITNPTHIAVAVKYDQSVADAPVVVAKGTDFIAKRIREIAEENNVTVVENKPLARSLFETVDIGEAIPPELYQAVAEVLAYVYNLKGTKV